MPGDKGPGTWQCLHSLSSLRLCLARSSQIRIYNESWETERERGKTSNCVKVTLIARKTQKEAPSIVVLCRFDADSPESKVDAVGIMKLAIHLDDYGFIVSGD